MIMKIAFSSQVTINRNLVIHLYINRDVFDKDSNWLCVLIRFDREEIEYQRQIATCQNF